MPNYPSSDHPPGIVASLRTRASERKKQRLLTSRKRRSLAASLRRAATRESTPSRLTVLLQDRVAAVRDELLEVAHTLEHADDLDASWVFAVHKLLTDGCESPLYNRDIHPSELRATLYFLRSQRKSQLAPVD